MTTKSHFLDYLFNPKSIALVGASGKEGKIGYFYLKNLLEYKGKIFPVNPKEEEVLGTKCYKSVSEIDEEIDLAVLVIASKFVVDVIKECAEKKVKVAVVTSAGFSETGEEGKKLEEEMLSIARKAGMRIVGPNCFGIRNCNASLNATFSFEASKEPGTISFLTQSGGGGEVIYIQGMDEGLKFSKFMVCGNKSDLDDYEVIDYFGNDPETNVICLFLESIKEGRKFYESAKKVSSKKPIVVCKVGRTEGAARAASSHTAAIAGNTVAFDTAFKQAGLIQTRNAQELIDVVKAVDWQPLPRGNKLGIITASGGLGVELTDLAEESGLEVPELEPEIQERIKALIPPFASARNPVDMTPIWGQFSEVMKKTIEAFYESNKVDIIVPIIVLRATRMTDLLESVRDSILECQNKYEAKKPVYICWISLKDSIQNKQIFENAKIPCYEWTGRIARTSALVREYASYLEKLKN
ncbi:MAG: acetyl-CoA synthetase [Candidatus Schekmanbacteria bacterium]|nr:MAG: acetyl-CoA synthetase [Candidatus Schekmanbacteria bacterium]